MPVRVKEKRSRSYYSTGLWVGTAIITLTLLVLTGNYYLNQWLQQQLTTLVYQQSKGVYALRLDGLRTSLFTGSITIDSLVLKPDYARWKQLQEKQEEVPGMLLHLRTGKVTLDDLSYWHALKGNSARIGSVTLASPSLELTKVGADTASRQQPLHTLASGPLKGLAIERIVVKQAQLRYNSQPGKRILSVANLQLQVQDFVLDSLSFAAPERVYYASEIALRVGKSSLRTSDGLYTIVADTLEADTQTGTASAAKLRLVPLLRPAAMARKSGKAVTYLKGQLARLQLQGVNFQEFSHNNQVQIRSMLLQQPVLSAFKDKKRFADEGRKLFPHDLVQALGTKFLIDTVQVQGMYVRYDELVENSTETGGLYFTNLNATVTNLTNMATHTSVKKPTVLKASARFMGKARVQATIKMPLLHKAAYHTIAIRVGEADPRLLNPILVPTSKMRVESGHISSGSATIELNNKVATGTMQLRYQDFEVDLLSEGGKERQSLGKKILSKVANKLVIKSDNPEKGKPLRTGTIKANRDSSASFLSYWKDALASGVLSSAGLEALSEK